MPHSSKITGVDLSQAVAGRTVFADWLGRDYEVLEVIVIPHVDRPVLVVRRVSDGSRKVITWWNGVADVEKADTFIDLNHPNARVMTP